MTKEYTTKKCSVAGQCLLVDTETNGQNFSLQMPIERAERICHCVNNFDDLLEALKATHSLNLGLCKSGTVGYMVFEQIKEAIAKAERGK